MLAGANSRQAEIHWFAQPRPRLSSAIAGTLSAITSTAVPYTHHPQPRTMAAITIENAPWRGQKASIFLRVKEECA
jgi:hypothetical protein